MTEINNIPVTADLSIRSHKLITGEPPAIQFTLVATMQEQPERILFSVPGWRVWKGAVHPPSRRVQASYLSVFNVEDKRLLLGLDALVQQLRKEYKGSQVSFPEDPFKKEGE